MIKWVTDWLGTCAMDKLPLLDENTSVLDVRDLVDKSGNSVEHINKKLNEAIQLKNTFKKVVICCDYGMSRSNSIALGVLSKYLKIDKYEALQIILHKVDESDIKLGTLQTVYKALDQENTVSLRNNILITGANGFIGKHLKKSLNNDYQLFCPKSKELDLSKNYLLLDAYIRQNNIGQIIHLANPRIFTHNSVVSESLLHIKNILVSL